MDGSDAAVAPAAGETPLKTSDAELDEARRRLAEEQQKRQSAELERDEARQHLRSERGRSVWAQEQAVAGAVEAAKARLAQAKRAYAQAMAESRYDESAELQAQIAEATLELK